MSPPPSWASRLVPWLQAQARPTLRKVVANSIWLMADRLVRLLVGLVVGVWVARHLGPAQYGEFAYVLAFVSFFQVASALGLDSLVVRDIAKNPADARTILATAFGLRLIGGLFCWLAAVLGFAWANPADRALVWAMALAASAVVFQAFDTVDLWFQAQSQNRRTVAAKFSALFVSATVKVGLIVGNAPLAAFVAVIGLEALVSALGLTVAYRMLPASGMGHAQRSYATHLVKEAWPYLLSGLLIMVYMRMDQIMIRTMAGHAELGRYAVALQLSQVWHAVPVALAASLAPFLFKQKLRGEAAYEAALLTMFRVFGGLGLACAALTALLAYPLVRALYGPAFENAAPVLAIHAFSNVFVFLGVAQSLWIVAESKGSLALARTFAGAVVAVALNLLLIPRLGAVGAAISAVASYAVAAVISNLFLAPRILTMQFGISPKAPRR